MKVGKISESVLKRSVIKFIKSKNENIKSGAGSDCAIFSCGDASFTQAVHSFALKEPTDIRFALMKAANNAACGGAVPVMAVIALLLPKETEEKMLQEIMKEADKAAYALHMQIAGGHTEVSESVLEPMAVVTVTGIAKAGGLLFGGAKAGQDVVATKWIGLEGTALLARRYGERLAERYPYHIIKEAEAFASYLSVLPEAAIAEKSNVSAMHDVSGGGIFAALWELAESAGVGLTIDLKKIPIRQETIEVCEFFGISPYELLSGGCLLMTADDGESLVQALEAVHIPAAVIGKVTDSHDRVVINEEEKRFLERPQTDAFIKIERRNENEGRVTAYH